MNLRKYALTQQIQTLYLGIVASIWLLALLLIHLYPLFPHSPPPSIPLIAGYEVGLAPKPMERFVFLTLAFLVPILTCLLVLIFHSQKFIVYSLKPFRSKLALIGIPIFFTLAFIYPFFHSDFLTNLMSVNTLPIKIPKLKIVLITSSLLTALIGCIWYVRSSKSTGKKACHIVLVWFFFLLAILLQITSFRLYNLNSFALLFSNQHHFDVVIYTLSQVVAGKTLLVDLPSQYGLFAEILAPIFSNIGLTIGSFTTVFAVLQIVSVCVLLFVLGKLIRASWVLLLLGGLTLIFLTYGTPLLFANIARDPYYQYWPIRFFWPSLSIFAFYFFSQKHTLLRAMVVSAIGAIGTFWNLDSGIFITIAFGAFLVTKYVFAYFIVDRTNTPPAKWLLFIGIHITVTIFIIAGLLGYLALQSHSTLNFFWLLEYPKIFYEMGFAMIPLPRIIHPWMSVLGIYLLGLIVSLYSWIYNPNQKSSDLIYFISILGLGLFVYYEGRSHVFNLISVCWPALILTILMTDRLIRGIRAKLLPKIYLSIATVSVGFYMLFSVIFVVHTKDFYDNARTTFQEAKNPTLPLASLIHSELTFIKEHSKNKRECLILSTQRQGIYYAEARLGSPVTGPSLGEMLLQRDLDNLTNAILTTQLSCIFLEVKDSKPTVSIDMKKLRKQYTIAAKNPEDTMLFLQPKKQN